jgi:hypothetical protein
VVEKWNQFVGPHGIRQDLFGFVDVLVLDPGRGFVGVQCCARSGHAAHRCKILEECTEHATEWIKCGGKIEIWSWAKQKVRRGGKAERWTPKVEEITLGAIEGHED